jgi:hypothetical protein
MATAKQQSRKLINCLCTIFYYGLIDCENQMHVVQQQQQQLELTVTL